MAIGAAGQAIPIIPSAIDIPFLHLPETDSLFADRALRLNHLAPGQAMGDYLRFVAEIAAAQQEALAAMPQTGLPVLDAALPPLSVDWLRRDPVWQQALRYILDTVSTKAPPAYASDLNQRFAAASGQEVERWAQSCLAGDFGHEDLGLMPLVAASLQVYWASLVQQLDGGAVGRRPAGQPTNLCPVCGSLPVGGVIRAGAASQGLRYLECSLCASQWHMERIRCVSCGDSAQVSYYGIEGTDGAVQAEACDACHTYTKLMHREKAPAVDVIADDLATLSLDVLMGEAGYRRFGRNPFILAGAE